MSDAARLFWRDTPRGRAPYAERADRLEGAADRVALGVVAHLRRPFSRALRRAAAVAALAEREQPAADALSAMQLREAAGALRAALLRHGLRDDVVAQSFALVRAAADRALGMRHFPVQLMGGHVLLGGRLAEMATGEGKTLTATLAAATMALAGVPVHVVTVNEYLARRDGEWMRPVYAALGLTVGIVHHAQAPPDKRAAYAADITYCTNKDLGFDYLRDTLALAARKGRGRLLVEQALGRGDGLDRLMLRGLYFAIVDEADSVLIDEARTPLIIAGAGDARAEADLYRAVLEFARQFEPEAHFVIERRERAARLTDTGRARLQALAEALPPAWRSARAREELAQQALAALHLFELDRHYLVKEGKVQIVDEYTGRVLADRSWERGLQQLIEVKEGCAVTPQRTTLARMTYQRLFRRFLRVSGMTGTAVEVAPELEAVYGLKVVRVPTHRPVRRTNTGTRLYATRAQKWQAVAETAARMRAAGRPVLIGTRSVAASEELDAVLAAHRVDHVVLNARQDDEEAEIVARAGEAGRITVATNMAGRGTDIRLGDGVAERGGLHVVLTEFHESRRIDRQLFGRGARQGDPGSCEAIVSLEDEIFVRHAAGLRSVLAARAAGQDQALGAAGAWLLRGVAQNSAERYNSHVRRTTLEADRKLDTALAFAGKAD